jgi:hypothetical protein
VPALHVVPGVGHEGDRMLGSACGRAALFDDATGAAACAGPPGTASAPGH